MYGWKMMRLPFGKPHFSGAKWLLVISWYIMKLWYIMIYHEAMVGRLSSSSFWGNPPFFREKTKWLLVCREVVLFPSFSASKNRFFQVWSCREMPRPCRRGGGRPRRGLHGLRGKQRLAALGTAHAAGLGTTIPETRKRDVGCRRVVGSSLVEGESKKSQLKPTNCTRWAAENPF